MLYLIYFIITLLGATATLIGLMTSSVPIEVSLTVAFIGVLIFGIWGCGIITGVKETIKKQISDLHSLKEFKENKESYLKQMDEYKEAMQSELLDKYRKFEEKLMENVKDSKLLAATLQQSGYSDVLKDYNETIKNFLNQINGQDRRISSNIKNMKVRQEDRFTGWGAFIPKRLRYNEG